MTPNYLLSIDGGGIRGIIPALALAKLEQETGRLTRDVFQFVAGTSTGALIAAGIAAGVPAEQIAQQYLSNAATVFPRHFWNTPKRIIRGSMYSTRALHDAVSAGLGPAQDWTLNDSPVSLLITAKRVADGRAWYFVRDSPANSGRTGCLGLVDCAVSSAAEPTYFEPWHVPSQAAPAACKPVGVLTGGGVGIANNPVYQACIEAFYYTTQFTPANTTIVSLGTGRFAGRSQPSWIWAWLRWVISELLESPGEQQTEIVQRHFPDTPFYRLDPDLKALDLTLTKGIALDEVASLPRLRDYGERFAGMIDWPAILNGTDTTFRITGENTLWYQYARP